jgi:molybdate transport system substrate-binding protein
LLVLAAAHAAAAEITVSAAASLGNAFKEAAQAFEAAHPGDKVLLNFAASDALVAQMAKGAPVDVFAAADQEAMDKAQALELVLPATRRNFVSNSVVLVVPIGSALQLSKLDDLRQPAITRLTTGNPASVPIGRYARAALSKAGLWSVLEPKMVWGTSVRQSLDYVARGEADAGLVYATDVAAQAGKVKAAFTVATDTPVTYPLAVLKAAPNAQGARQFADFLLSAAGQTILARHGFGHP